MKKLMLAFTLLSLIACGGSKNVKSDYAVEKLVQYDADALRNNYSDANIKEGTDMFEEGTEERPYSVLYPGTPDELTVIWKDDSKNNVYEIRFSGEGKWHSKEGIKVGTTYDELVALNSGPISFYGFGWDYSGAVLWNGGKLENSKVKVFLSPEGDPPSEFYGDHVIKASPEEIDDLNLKVSTVILRSGE